MTETFVVVLLVLLALLVLIGSLRVRSRRGGVLGIGDNR